MDSLSLKLYTSYFVLGIDIVHADILKVKAHEKDTP